MRKVNLEDTLKLHCNVAEYDKNAIIFAMKDACRQVLELAAENIKADALERFGTDISDCWDEDSIINTIKQVE